MARLWSSGFELNSSLAGMEWTNNTTCTTVSTGQRSGSYAGEVTAADLSGSTPVGWSYQFAAATGNGPYYFRFYLKIHTAPTALNYIAVVSSSASVSLIGNGCILQLNTNRTLTLIDNALLSAGTSSALTLDTWYKITIKSDNVGTSLIAQLNDVQFGTSTSTAAVLALKVGGNLDNGGNAGGDWFFDDIAINDSTGSFQNTYPGDGSIIHLRPNAPGDNAQFPRGGTDSGVNWSQVNEVTPNDSTNNITNNNTGQIDDYNITDTPGALNAISTINVVAVGFRFHANGASLNSSLLVRVKATASGTVEEGTEIIPTSTIWLTNALVAPKNYPLTLYDLPGASTSAWTKATLDTAQIGAKIVTGSTNNAEVTAIWLLVEYVAGVFTPGRYFSKQQAVKRASYY